MALARTEANADPIHRVLAGVASELRQARQDHELIERAKVLLTRHAGYSEGGATILLLTLACRQNRELAEVARSVVAAGEVLRQLERLNELEAADAAESGQGAARPRPIVLLRGPAGRHCDPSRSDAVGERPV